MSAYRMAAMFFLTASFTLFCLYQLILDYTALPFSWQSKEARKPAGIYADVLPAFLLATTAAFAYNQCG
jgi:hypothetical protein